jgi:hypothetical protein
MIQQTAWPIWLRICHTLRRTKKPRRSGGFVEIVGLGLEVASDQELVNA